MDERKDNPVPIADKVRPQGAGVVSSTTDTASDEDEIAEIKSAVLAKLTLAVGKVLSRVAPGAGVVQLDATAVSRDPEVVRRYDTDPLNYRGKVAARTAAELVDLANAAPERLREITLPLLVFQGSADRLVPVKASQLVHEKAGSTDKTLKTYEGLYHETMNEPEKDEVIAMVAEWLDSHLAPAEPGQAIGSDHSTTPSP